MRDLNMVQLIGRLGGEPEMRFTPAGQAVTNARIATNRRWTATDGTVRDEVAWHRLTFFGELAKIAGKHLRVGSRCYVQGRLQYREWQDKEGVKRLAVDIIVDELLLLGDRVASGAGVPAGEGDSDIF